MQEINVTAQNNLKIKLNFYDILGGNIRFRNLLKERYYQTLTN